MSPSERDEHRQKMMGFKTYDECKAYIDEHHKQMDERAKEILFGATQYAKR